VDIFKKLAKDKAGNFAITMALMILPAIPIIGGAVDYSRVLYAEIRLENSLDFATTNYQHANKLSSSTRWQIKSMVKANYESDALRIRFSRRNKKIHVEARDIIETPLLAIIGKDKMQVVAKTSFHKSLW